MLTIVGLAALALAAASPAEAQRELKHRGFWIGFGAGGGWNTSDELDGETLGGGAVYFRLGGTPSERLLVGGEVIGWFRDQDGATVSRGNVTLSLLLYPSRNGGLFLKGGVGAAQVTVSQTIGNVTTTVTDGGLGTTLGAGYDIRLGRNFYLTPNIDFLFQSIDDVNNTLTLLSVGVTWH